MEIWKVTIEDLTNLGGPMGTEYTTTIGSKEFSTKEKAMEFIKKSAGHYWGMGDEPEIVDYVDAGSRGYRLEKAEVF